MKKLFGLIKIPKLAKDSIYVVGSQVIKLVTRFAWGILIARWLGAEAFGLYFYWTGIFAIIFTFADFGSSGFLLKNLNSTEEPKSLFQYQTNYVYKLALAIFLISLSYIVIQSGSIIEFVIAISSLIITFSDKIFAVNITWFYKEERAPYIAFLGVYRSLFLVIAGYILFLIEIPAYLVLFLPAFASFIILLITSLQLKTRYRISIYEIFQMKLSLSDVRRIYKNIWIFGVLTLLNSLPSQLDPVLLKILNFSDADIGNLGVARKLIAIASISGSSILNVIFPRLTKDFFQSSKKFTQSFISILPPLVIVSVMIMAFFGIFSSLLIKQIFGLEYIESIKFVQLFSLGCFVPLLILSSSALIAAGMEKKMVWINVFFVIVIPLSKLLAVSLTDKYGIGYVEAVSPYLSLSMFLFLLHKSFSPKPPAKFYIHTFLVLLLTVSTNTISYVTQYNPFILFVGFLLLLAVLNYLLSYVNISDILKLRKKAKVKSPEIKDGDEKN